MSQVSGRPCPACGTPVPAGQRFCSNCGTDMEVSRPASQYGGPPPQNFPQAQPVPPYAQSPYGQQQQYQQPQQKSNPIAEALGALGLLFFLRRYRPGYQARRQSSGCCGCLVTLVILAIFLGIPGFLIYRSVGPTIVSNFQSATKCISNAAPTKTVHPNQTTHYAGLTWTLTTASTSSCNNNMSADQGTVFVKVTLKVDNPTSQPFINSVYSYIRLQSGSTTSSPMSGSDTPLPSSIESNTAGTMGIVTFSMPQGSNSFTLILLPQTNPAISQSTINFQI